MTVFPKESEQNHFDPVVKPEELESIVHRRNDKMLYFAIKNIAFDYNTLYNYLIKAFFLDSVQIARTKSELLSELMEVSESTFYRWKKNRKKVEEKYAERLAELIALYAYGEEVFESKRSFLEWLNASNIHLDKKAPLYHLDSFPGIRYVKHLLDKIEYGAPV